MVLNALRETGANLSYYPEGYNIWWLPKEIVQKVDLAGIIDRLSPEVYLRKLSRQDVGIANEIWPFRFEGSEEYLATFAEMNNCYGLFLKSDDTLISWIFKNHMGAMGVLQTLDGYQNKGYGYVLSAVLGKEIAKDGHEPIGTIRCGNKASEKIYVSNGCRSLGKVDFIVCLPRGT